MRFLLATPVISTALLIANSTSGGQIAFDGSINGAVGRTPYSQLSRSPYTVREEDGLIRGANSFLSFAQFALAKGDEVSFLGPTQVRNVIARVTGGNASTIDGRIESPQAGVNLFLVNPAGIIFGPSASLDVFGAFTASTANFIRFADGAKFTATVPLSPSLSSAVPAAFGFLGARPPAAIRVGQEPTGGASSGATGASTPGPTLQVNSGEVLSLIGGAIQISQGEVAANGGRVNLISAGGAGEVALDTTDPKATANVTGLITKGAISLDGGALVSADLGGSVLVRGDSLTMSQSFIVTDTDAVPAGDIDIALDGACVLNNSRIDLSTSGAASAGSLILSAGSVAIHGNIVYLNDNQTVAVSAASTSAGNGGNVDIESRGDITIDQHASITSSANSSGNGGDITVRSERVFTIDGDGEGNPLTGLVAETTSPSFGAGNAGRIRTISPRLNILSEGQVTSRTKGPGDAGLIRLDLGQLLIDGGHTHSAILTGLQARVGDDNGGAQGSGGRIVLNADGITLLRGGVITASTFGRGDAGGMQIQTGSLLIEGSPKHQFTGLFARTTKATDAGNGGGIDLVADSLQIDGPGEISASSDRSSGNAGGVLVQVARKIDVSDGGLITVRSDFTNAGDLVVGAGSGIALYNGNIDASAAENGGNIELTTRKGLSLLHDSTISGKAGGDGGHITLNAPVVADGDSTVNGLSAANKTPVKVRIATSGDLFTSNATFLGGDIITPPPYDLSGQLVNLVSSLAAPAARVIELCGHRIEGEFSSFVVVGKNGVAPTPDSPQPAGR